MESNQIIILASLIFFKMILIGIGFWSNRFAKKDETILKAAEILQGI